MIAPLSKLNHIVISRPLLFIFSLFLLVQAILFYKIGVFTGLEAEKYIEQGNLLYKTGELSEPKYIFYLPVILLVYFCRLTDVPVHFIVLVQVILFAIALFYFYKLGKNIGNKTIAFYSTALLILFIPLQIWNFYLYSDSIFISLTIIFTCLVYMYGERGSKGIIIILLFLFLLIFSRPNGMLFIPPLIIFLLFKTWQSRQLRILCMALSLFFMISLYFLMNMAFRGGGDLDILKPFVEEHIICFIPTKTTGTNIDIVKTENPLNDLFYYIIHNPIHFLRLTALKLFSFFNLTRSYYSTAHNIFLLIFIIPVYFFSFIGLVKFSKSDRNSSLFILSLLVLYPLAISFQCDDWHSRFTMIIMPYLILFGVHGFEKTRKHFSFKNTHELF